MTESKEDIAIYHNPRCSKSRTALELLRERGIEPRVIEYLKTPPSREQLRELLGKLGLRAEQLVRRGEDVFKTRFAGRGLSEAEWLDAMASHPILIERPVVVRGNRAVIGRPPEKVLELL
ncbi:MAG: arsenate reductase (glutaredoxin) [Burkholderiales bacterium]|nr:arsenate reductase (glutaredoxin) [Burkholderiales bacterium]